MSKDIRAPKTITGMIITIIMKITITIAITRKSNITTTARIRPRDFFRCLQSGCSKKKEEEKKRRNQLSLSVFKQALYRFARLMSIRTTVARK